MQLNVSDLITAETRARTATGRALIKKTLSQSAGRVRDCTLEPSGIRTNWARCAGQNAPDLLPDYEASVGSVFDTDRTPPTFELLNTAPGFTPGSFAMWPAIPNPSRNWPPYVEYLPGWKELN